MLQSTLSGNPFHHDGKQKKVESFSLLLLVFSTPVQEKVRLHLAYFGHQTNLIIVQNPIKTHKILASSFQENPNENGRLHFENHGILFCHIDCLYSFESCLQHLVETQKPGEAAEAARHQRYSLQAFVWRRESYEAVIHGGTLQTHGFEPFYCSSCHSILP